MTAARVTVRGYSPSNRPLSDREQRFVSEYLIDLDPQAALVRAGFRVKFPAQRASKLLNDPRIKAAIDHAKAARAERTKTDADWVLRQARQVYERVVQEVEPALHPKTRKQLRAEDGRPLFTFNAAAALRALEIIGRHVDVGAFEERVAVDLGQSLVEILQQRGRQASPEPIDITPDHGGADPDRLAEVRALTR